MRKSWMAFGCVLLISLLGLSANPAMGSQFVGEYCLHLTRPGDPDSEVAVLGVSLEGDDHYSIHGRLTSLIGGGGVGETTPSNGGLELLDGAIVLTLTKTEREDVPGGGLFGHTIVRLQLDPGTLDGTFRAITTLFDLSSGQFDPPEYDEGIATFLPDCVP